MVATYLLILASATVGWGIKSVTVNVFQVDTNDIFNR